jgi:hypothetical protein
MKRSALFWMFFSLIFVGGISVKADVLETQETSNQETIDETEQKGITKVYAGRGGAENNRISQLRDYRYSYLDPVGVYAQVGDVLTVNVQEKEGMKLAIGSPKRNTEKTFVLKQGENTIQVENEGPVYVINTTDEDVTISVNGASGQMPFFTLGETTVEEFKAQMTQFTNAKDVQLVSQKAMVTVSYAMAKKYLGNPEELMKYYDRFLLAQDKVSGITDEGKPVNHTDRHLQHFVEVPFQYMYTDQEYMGFHGDLAMERLLKTNNGWGVWHESGHQRQQTPWKWSGVKESTVNIYSMAAQKELYGKITALDQYYPQMYQYLAKDNSEKVFNDLSNDVKMVMFGQLEMIFGEKFYPRLHQYYRENRINISSDAEKIQQFILNVSKITGYNMADYFEKWGFTINENIKVEMSNYLPLTSEIWQTGSKTIKELPMQIISNVQLSAQSVEVVFLESDTNLLANEKIVLLKNGEVIAEMDDGQPSASSINGNSWQIETTVAEEDTIQIAVQKEDGLHPLYESSIYIQTLAERITNLMADNSLATATNQEELDHFREVINSKADQKDQRELLNQLEKLQQAYLNTLFDQMELSENNELTIHFSDERFQSYEHIVVKGDGQVLAEINNGTATNGTLNGNILQLNTQGVASNFSIEVEYANQSYEIALVKKPLLEIMYQLNSYQNHTAVDAVTQEKINQLKSSIEQLAEPNDVKNKLSQQLQKIQQNYLEELIEGISAKGNKLAVTFVDERYKNYKIVILKDGSYMAEVTNGKVYYGNLANHVFLSTSNLTPGSEYRVEVRLTDKTYTIARQTF